MALISVNVTPDMVDYKRKNELKWANLILEGMNSHNAAVQNEVIREKMQEIQKKFDVLQADFNIRGKKLARYIEKYGMDEDIMFGNYKPEAQE